MIDPIISRYNDRRLWKRLCDEHRSVALLPNMRDETVDLIFKEKTGCQRYSKMFETDGIEEEWFAVYDPIRLAVWSPYSISHLWQEEGDDHD